MPTSRIVFGICLLTFGETFLALSMLVESADRFHVIIFLGMFLCLWGSMTYFSKSRFAAYRFFWFSCAAITVASYIMLFGSTVFFEEMPVYDSEHQDQIKEFNPNGQSLYQHPLLVYRLYTTAYTEILDASNPFRTNPAFIGSVLLSVALPVAFFISLYHCWKPIKQNG